MIQDQSVKTWLSEGGKMKSHVNEGIKFITKALLDNIKYKYMGCIYKMV